MGEKPLRDTPKAKQPSVTNITNGDEFSKVNHFVFRPYTLTTVWHRTEGEARR